ncbi:hypothetical protein [Saccharopolyspora flava]|uniref:Small secreted domain n=1 Tax=Saccharopolyspora flava TaxID=95161 RepID=A0A1I6S9U3_9PSEU|nr:hypothetical protein [Saccharopolyspora flava]SFS73707.1 hypothetical protein SAMN05660874_03021 [Saccharopolyspora flava]
MRTLRERSCWTAALTLGAGLVVGVLPASADTTDNDGINLGNDNNTSVAPVQLCGNNVGVLGAVAPIGSGQDVECTNAPVVDHPEAAEVPEPPAEQPPAEQPPAEQPPAEQPPAEQPPADSGTEVLPEQETPADSSTQVQDTSESLPEAPSPEAAEGHVAVTG